MTDAGILDGLTTPQLEAATHMDGPMLVVAGAGSGKTRVVTRRIAYLISKGIWPNQILAMTFTNKAAGEMKERVEHLVGSRPPWIGTFHSVCARLLRRDMDKLPEEGRTQDFTIYDAEDQAAVVKAAMKALHINPKELSPGAVLARISDAKCRLTEIDDTDGRLAAIQERYEQHLRQMNALDFDDLLLFVLRLLQRNPAQRDIYHSRFRYVLVDEYQDTNRLQYELLRLLVGPDENVHATGDPDQSIYSWRGAEYRNIMDFTVDYPAAKLVRLERNYRSTEAILDAANNLIRHNENRIPKELFTERSGGTPVRVVGVAGDRDEAEWVARRVVQLHLDGVALRDMAVFYRTNAQSHSLEPALMAEGLPYIIVGGTKFFARKEIKDIVCHLKLMLNPRDSIALRRVAGCRPTGVGEKTLEAVIAQAEAEGIPVMDLLADVDFPGRFRGRCSAKLAEFAAWCRALRGLSSPSFCETIRDVIAHSGLLEHYAARQEGDPLAEARIENLQSLASNALEFASRHPDAGLDAYLEEVALVADIDDLDPEADLLPLMTLHSSKGLEFQYVFIVGVEEGYLPCRSSGDSEEAIEEERRLLYVGMTRGKEEVCLLHAQTRFIWSEVQYRVASRFLRELPKDVVEHVGLRRTYGRYSHW